MSWLFFGQGNFFRATEPFREYIPKLEKSLGFKSSHVALPSHCDGKASHEKIRIKTAKANATNYEPWISTRKRRLMLQFTRQHFNAVRPQASLG